MKKYSIFMVFFIGVLAGCGTGNKSISGDTTTDHEGVDVPIPCTDHDGDGYGTGCSRGGDCDDTDEEVWNSCSDCSLNHDEGCACEAGESYFCYEGPPGTQGVGQCARGVRNCIDDQLGPCEGQVLPTPLEDCGDGIDNNCNNLTDDEDYLCSDCAPPCYSDGLVVPDPDDPGSTGLVPNPDGPGVVLGSDENEAGYGWIANCGEGTVSKIDIATLTEVGRFRVGLTGTGTDSPSRTAVDDYQMAYVANRAHVDASMNQGSVTKIAGIERYCQDLNGNGTIDTSHNSTPMALDTDECVLWTVPVGGPAGIPRALVIDYGDPDRPSGNPWVGLYNERRFYRLDATDGSVMETVDINVTPYGAAIDAGGWVWASGRGNQAIQRFHYVDGTVEPAVSLPSSSCGGGNEPYGIGIDLENRVWVGVLPGSGACRYDADTGSWFHVALGGSGRGVAVDLDDVMWVTNYDTNQLHRFNAEDGSGLATYNLTGASPAVGVGVDRNHKIWAIEQGSNSLNVFDPATSGMQTVPVGSVPYTYSDFLGFQRWIMMPFGLWIQVFERCDDREEDKWLDVSWDVETPGDSSVAIVGRSASTVEGILSADEVTIAEIGGIGPDPDVGSKDLEAVYEAAGSDLGKFIEITVTMRPSSADPPESPVFKGLQVFYYCVNIG
jgi:hypothetical protein